MIGLSINSLKTRNYLVLAPSEEQDSRSFFLFSMLY